MKKYYIPPNAPPPLTMEQCTTRRTQKDSFDVESTAKPLTFDDLESGVKIPQRTRQGDSSNIVFTTSVRTFDDWETVPKRYPRVRQGDSMTTRVNKVVNTSVYIPFFNDYPQHKFAPLPEDSLQVMHPGAKLIECPEELKMGMNALKPIPLSGDPNQILECYSYR